MPRRPPALFVAALAPCSALCLTRTGARTVEVSWAPLWTRDSPAAKRLLCSLQRQTSSSFSSMPSFLTEVIRQEVDPATGTFSLWTRRPILGSACMYSKSPASLLIASLWITYTLSKVIAPTAANRAFHVMSFLDAVLESMQQSYSGSSELSLSAPILVTIMSSIDNPKFHSMSTWIGCADEAITQIAECLQAFMRGLCSFDNWMIVCALSLKPCERLASPNYSFKISVASSIELFLSSLITVVQELAVAAQLALSTLSALVIALSSTIIVPFEGLANSSTTDISSEPLYARSLSCCENGDTMLIHGLRSNLISIDSLDDYLHMTGVQNNSGETALMVAIKTRQQEFMSALIPLEAGCIDCHGNTAITLLLSSGNNELFRYLAAILPYEKEALRKLAFTDLMLEVLSEPHAEPTTLDQARQQTIHGYTALMIAVIVGHLSAVRVLAPLEAGMRNRKFKQAGTLALEMARQDCIELLLPYEDIRDSQANTALHRAVRDSFTTFELGKYYHMMGRYNASGRTALMEAAICGNVEAVMTLIEHEGRMVTPRTATIAILPPDNTSKKSQTIIGATAFMLCLIQLSSLNSEYEKVLRVLSEREGDIICSDGVTPLMILGILNKPYLYPFCRRTLGVADNKGKTALMYAAEHAAYGFIPLLIDHEGGLQDASGWTALLYAVRDNNIADMEAIVGLIQREGSLVNRWGWSALIYAVHNNNTNLIQLLLPASTREQIAQAQRHIQRSDPSNEQLISLFTVLNIV
ncbi:Protein 21.1 [Giardia duodenalis ATCC 50581]|uniref:Protein 21.1 n=1 Tax=Giardia intestinalis (strain ATCC 50581 / GS clone H7) TaxID=598745 RepID=C6LTF4_GIAIB|nr:Protein 21.1 [Giardia intestinalis ATCC 50581]